MRRPFSTEARPATAGDRIDRVGAYGLQSAVQAGPTGSAESWAPHRGLRAAGGSHAQQPVRAHSWYPTSRRTPTGALNRIDEHFMVTEMGVGEAAGIGPIAAANVRSIIPGYKLDELLVRSALPLPNSGGPRGTSEAKRPPQSSTSTSRTTTVDDARATDTAANVQTSPQHYEFTCDRTHQE